MLQWTTGFQKFLENNIIPGVAWIHMEEKKKPEQNPPQM